jgi:hypothetical protein
MLIFLYEYIYIYIINIYIFFWLTFSRIIVSRISCVCVHVSLIFRLYKSEVVLITCECPEIVDILLYCR